MTNEMLVVAMRDYFRGERHEMLAILVGALALPLLAIGLYVAMRDGFAKGFAGAVLVSALLLAAAAASLLRRDPPLQAALEAGMRSPGATQAVASEADRIAGIVRRYPVYRYGALSLGLTALAAVVVTRRGWVHGAAAGVLILVVAQLIIDHYSERRASHYAVQLAEGLKARASSTAPTTRP